MKIKYINGLALLVVECAEEDVVRGAALRCGRTTDKAYIVLKK